MTAVKPAVVRVCWVKSAALFFLVCESTNIYGDHSETAEELLVRLQSHNQTHDTYEDRDFDTGLLKKYTVEVPHIMHVSSLGSTKSSSI